MAKITCSTLAQRRESLVDEESQVSREVQHRKAAHAYEHPILPHQRVVGLIQALDVLLFLDGAAPFFNARDEFKESGWHKQDHEDAYRHGYSTHQRAEAASSIAYCLHRYSLYRSSPGAGGRVLLSCGTPLDRTGVIATIKKNSTY
jgi:hypothetical protein